MSKHLIFYSDCHLITGYFRGLMYDLTRPYNVSFLPVECADLINYSKRADYQQLIDYFSNIHSEQSTIAIIDFLLEKDFAFIGNDLMKSIIKEIDLTFDHYSTITNVVIDIDHASEIRCFDDSILFETYLGNLGCYQLHVNILNGANHVFDGVNFNSLFENINIKFLGNVLPDNKVLEKLCLRNQVNSIEVFSELENYSVLENEKIKLVDKKNFTFPLNSDDFELNITLFTESQAHHTYFNRKLYIGPNGEIKNAPECPETFGYIQDLENPEQLKAIVQTPEFQKYWFVHKEITDVCKDCEFRHMCVDNRLPYQRAENQWYHKQECNYNPYIAKWKGEEGYRTLAECGVISNENGFSIDHEKIAKINEELWGED